MKVLDDLKIQPKCLDCELRTESFFCNLSQANLQVFESLKRTRHYPSHSALFMEGQPSDGVYILCQGRVKLSTCSRDGKVIILHIAEAGETLGLTATVSDSIHLATAEALESCQVNFVGKDDFLRFVQQNSEVCFNVVKQLSHKYHTAYIQIRSLGLSASAADKLTKLLLELSKANGSQSGESIRLKVPYTHEEIAEMIGTSRETVTRLMKSFRDRDLIFKKGSDVIIPDLGKLEATIGVPYQAKM